MALVSVGVDARRYEITCDDGQEEHVLRLAAEIDRRAGALVGNLGQIGEARLLLLVALLLCDELAEARDGLRHRRDDTGARAPADGEEVESSGNGAEEDRLLDLARRVTAVAHALAGPAADPE